ATFIVPRADLKDPPRIRAFIDFMAPHLATIRKEMEARAQAMKPQKAAALAAVLAAREGSSPPA
ncbi:MAG: hypothetical protein KAF42_15500, partial [Sphingopyxis terrae]|nr:hypothetical protein [Sphingopyxis terrae]